MSVCNSKCESLCGATPKDAGVTNLQTNSVVAQCGTVCDLTVVDSLSFGPNAQIGATCSNTVKVYSIDDLPAPDVDNNIVLASGTIYQPCGVVDLGVNTLMFQPGTTLWSPTARYNGFTSTSTDPLVQSDYGGRIQGIRLIQPNGPCIDITTDLGGAAFIGFDIGFIGSASVGSIGNTPAAVDAMCYFRLSNSVVGGCADGLTIKGRILDGLITQIIFDNNTGTFTAVTLDGTVDPLNMGPDGSIVIHIVADVFEAGQTFVSIDPALLFPYPDIGRITLSNNQITGAGTPLLPATAFADPNVITQDNTGIRNSAVIGAMSYTGLAEVIPALSGPTKLLGPFTIDPLTQRFSITPGPVTGDTLVYIGKDVEDGNASLSLTYTPSVGATVIIAEVRVAGASTPATTFTFGSFGFGFPNTASVTFNVALTPSDTIEIFVDNTSGGIMTITDARLTVLAP